MLKNRLDEALNQIQQDASHEAIHTIIEELLMSLTHSEQSTLYCFEPEQMRLYNHNGSKSLDVVVVGAAGLLGSALL